jgi:quercetin dioxygenase-like cupin family protein
VRSQTEPSYFCRITSRYESTNHLTGGSLIKRSLQFFTAGIIALLWFLNSGAFAQDPVKVDSTHYKVEFENDQVRVLRITYGPGEKSVMHEHPNAVAVFLTDVQGQFTFPDEKTQAMTTEVGQTLWTPAGKHLPENTGAKPFSLILVELKSTPATIKKN